MVNKCGSIYVNYSISDITYNELYNKMDGYLTLSVRETCRFELECEQNNDLKRYINHKREGKHMTGQSILSKYTCMYHFFFTTLIIVFLASFLITYLAFKQTC